MATITLIDAQNHPPSAQGPPEVRQCGFWGASPLEPPDAFIVPRHLPGPTDTLAALPTRNGSELPLNVVDLDAFRNRSVKLAA